VGKNISYNGGVELATITQDVAKFLDELTELTKKHRIYIDSYDTLPDLYSLETHELLEFSLSYDTETNRYEVQLGGN
jgi:PHP family Zn ribbon phosphoesterase